MSTKTEDKKLSKIRPLTGKSLPIKINLPSENKTNKDRKKKEKIEIEKKSVEKKNIVEKKSIKDTNNIKSIKDNNIESINNTEKNNTEDNNIEKEAEKDELNSNTVNIVKSISYIKRPKTAQDRFRIRMKNINNMFNTPSTLLLSPLKRPTYTYKSSFLPPIPPDQVKRLTLLKQIFSNEAFVSHFMNAPSVLQSSLDEIGDYLNKWEGRYSELEKYAMFFYYICNKVKYDIREDNKEITDLNIILKSGKASSLQFSRLFEYFCKSHHLKFKHIKGFCKLKAKPKFIPKSPIKEINHCWNAINFQSMWYLVDLTFGSGGIKTRREDRTDYFNPYYFLTTPENLVDTHFPVDELWQLTHKTISANQFGRCKAMHLPNFFKKVYEKNIRLVTHEYPIIRSSKKLTIKLGLKDMTIMANLYYSNFKLKISEIKFSFNDRLSEFTLEPVFPENGEYWIQILYREFSSSEPNFKPLINYFVLVDDSKEKIIEEFRKKKEKEKKRLELIREIKRTRPKSLNIPKMGTIIDRETAYTKKLKNICLDNEDAHIIIPSQRNLKIGVENEFKLKVPNSESVVVLDGHTFNHLRRGKKDKNLWEGKILLRNENVSILSQKNQHIFTEVFRLKAHFTSSVFFGRAKKIMGEERKNDLNYNLLT